MTIESARVVYIVAPSGTGKSFTGDYLAVVHGFEHVDGDAPFKRMHLPQYRDMTKKLLQYSNQHKDLDLDSSKKMLAPYHEEIAKCTLQAAKYHDKVVLSHATGFQIARDIILQVLVKGGVKPEHITVLELTINKDVKRRGLYHRTKRMAAEAGMTLKDLLKGWGVTDFDDIDREITVEEYIKLCVDWESDPKKNDMQHFDDCPGAKKVDVSGRDVTSCDAVDAALGLTRDKKWSDYEDIVNKVKPLDEQRDAEYGNGWKDTCGEIMAEITSALALPETQDEVKLESMKKRRSSIIQADLLNGSLSSIGSSEEIQRRLSSLILTGHIEV